MASPASNHGIALLASDCQSRSSECSWFIMSGSCGFPGCLQASTRAPLVGVTRRLSFGAARTNFLLLLDFLTRTAVADSLFLIGTTGIFTAHLTRLSSANGGTIPPARTTTGSFFGRYSGPDIPVLCLLIGLAGFHLSSPFGS
jgi:hypothetical protein